VPDIAFSNGGFVILDVNFFFFIVRASSRIIAAG
jgi:hypothetical protein